MVRSAVGAASNKVVEYRLRTILDALESSSRAEFH